MKSQGEKKKKSVKDQKKNWNFDLWSICDPARVSLWTGSKNYHKKPEEYTLDSYNLPIILLESDTEWRKHLQWYQTYTVNVM